METTDEEISLLQLLLETSEIHVESDCGKIGHLQHAEDTYAQKKIEHSTQICYSGSNIENLINI